MDEVLIALVTGIVIPTARMVLERHYERNPKSWEQVFALVALTTAALGGAVLSYSFYDASTAWSILLIPVVGVCAWVAFAGLSETKSAIQELRKNPPGQR